MLAFGKATERDLMRRFRAGDRDAFTSVYKSHSAAVHRFALYMTADEGKAVEVTQDVFVWLIHHPEAFDPTKGDLGAFLAGVARKFVQRRWQQDKRWVPFDESTATTRYAGPEAEEETDDTAQLRGAIAALPERYREVVVLCDLEEKSYEDAASSLQCATGTIRSRLHRARSLLARKLLGGRDVQAREGKVKEAVRYSA